MRSIGPSGNAYALDGKISSTDNFDFGHTKLPLVVIINSGGGDLKAAMKLGRELRNADARAIVREGDYCASACVFVLAGAVDRSVQGRVGIHRPYPTRTGNETRAQAQQDFDQMRSRSRRYLKEMNMSDTLFEAIISVPSREVRYLNDKELAAFGLSGTDPVYQYQQDSKAAARYGISRSTLLHREKLGEERCLSLGIPANTAKQVGAYLDCENSIMWGLSIPELHRRQKMGYRFCVKQHKVSKQHIYECRNSVLRTGRLPGNNRQ